ncbi:hypothetical protein [Treponema denticola]|nr:hypothetical protein [Treponema denticola]
MKGLGDSIDPKAEYTTKKQRKEARARRKEEKILAKQAKQAAKEAAV